VPDPAVLVFERMWGRRPREVVHLAVDDETPIEGEDVSGEYMGPMAIVAWRDGAWRVRPCSRVVTLDCAPLVEEVALRHGQCITVGYVHIRFLAGDTARVLDEESHIATCMDPLTNLVNRRYFMRHLDRQPAPTALLMIDIDWMKRLNDVYGHLVGDEVLIRTAERIRAHLRWPECAGRYGGEEFVVTLQTPPVPALARAEAIRAACEPLLEIEEHSIEARVSIGVAMYDGDVASTLRRADEFLMQAKRDGRNRVVTG
jgi:two-component system, cell cycle response regulator